MVKKKAKVKAKVKKKNFFPILAPKLFNNRVLGKTPLYDFTKIEGKVLKSNLMALTGDMKKQNINISFKVIDVKDGQGQTIVWEYKIISAYLKRMIRRKRDKIASSFIIKTIDKIEARIKPVVLTRNKVSRSVKTDLHNALVKKINELISKTDFESLVKNIIYFKFQLEIKSTLNKITPIKTVEISNLKRLTEEEIKIQEKKKEEKTEKEEKDEEKKVTKIEAKTEKAEEKKETKTPKKAKVKKEEA